MEEEEKRCQLKPRKSRGPNIISNWKKKHPKGEETCQLLLKGDSESVYCKKNCLPNQKKKHFLSDCHFLRMQELSSRNGVTPRRVCLSPRSMKQKEQRQPESPLWNDRGVGGGGRSVRNSWHSAHIANAGGRAHRIARGWGSIALPHPFPPSDRPTVQTGKANPTLA